MTEIELIALYWTVSGPADVHVGREWSLFEWRDRCAEAAGDGRHESYKLSLRFDNPQARLSHGFPLDVTQKEVQEMLFKEAGGP